MRLYVYVCYYRRSLFVWTRPRGARPRPCEYNGHNVYAKNASFDRPSHRPTRTTGPVSIKGLHVFFFCFLLVRRSIDACAYDDHRRKVFTHIFLFSSRCYIIFVLAPGTRTRLTIYPLTIIVIVFVYERRRRQYCNIIYKIRTTGDDPHRAGAMDHVPRNGAGTYGRGRYAVNGNAFSAMGKFRGHEDPVAARNMRRPLLPKTVRRRKRALSTCVRVVFALIDPFENRAIKHIKYNDFATRHSRGKEKTLGRYKRTWPRYFE